MSGNERRPPAADGGWAAIAMADVVLLLLLEPLLKRRLWALSAVALCLVALWWISQSRYALMPLLVPPVAFIALAAWLFGRTLSAGRVPLITRIVEGLYAQAGMPMTPALHRYTRQLTVAWALMLSLLALANLALALCAVPSGVLAQLGTSPALSVTDEQWSIFANLLNYGIVGVFFVIEYQLRIRRFPHRPYRNAWQFVTQMGQLGPRFWNALLR
ncbi:MAG: ketosynthase [Pseudoxanthomonas sp.]